MLAARDEINQLIEDLDDLELFPDPLTLTPAHFAALELIELGDTAFDFILEALHHHPKRVVRGWAAWILGEMGDRRAIPALTAAAHHDPYHYVRHEAQASLALLR